jgi:hypothetical protein
LIDKDTEFEIGLRITDLQVAELSDTHLDDEQDECPTLSFGEGSTDCSCLPRAAVKLNETPSIFKACCDPVQVEKVLTRLRI